jgi:polysaccharide export outer membrane protein
MRRITTAPRRCLGSRDLLLFATSMLWMASLLITGCGTQQHSLGGGHQASISAHPPSKGTSRGTIVQPGDVLEVFVAEDDSLNARYEVRAGGHIILPKVGKIEVAGKTIDEIESTIKKMLEGNQLRTATVMVEIPASPRIAGVPGKTVFVSGNVSAPGRHTVPFVGDQRPTVYQCIIDAGGFTRFADQSRVMITRRSPDGGATRINADAKKIRDGAATDIPVEDGDLIFVPEKSFGW